MNYFKSQSDLKFVSYVILCRNNIIYDYVKLKFLN